PNGDCMLARELVLHSMLELATGSASLTPIELGERALRIALALVECDGVALLAPRHRDSVRILRGRTGERVEPELVPRESSRFVRLVARGAHPLIVPDLTRESRAQASDTFPGVAS